MSKDLFKLNNEKNKVFVADSTNIFKIKKSLKQKI